VDKRPCRPKAWPNSPDGKVLYKTTAGGEWLQDDADITNGAFNGFTNKESAVEVVIPSKDANGNSVTSIGAGAFADCRGLTSVTIPDSVTSIGSFAFLRCSGLMSILVGSGNASYKSVNGLLLSKDGKTLIQGVNGNVTIPNSVTSIVDGAFRGCSGLTSVTIGNNVEEIGSDAFYDCTSVNDVYCWPNPANLTWNEDAHDDFKEDGSTRCHTKAEYLAAYQTKFGGGVNVTFVGDLA